MRLADVQFSNHDDVVVARLLGELDMSNAEGIGRALVEATPNRMAGLVLDMRQVDYLDSAGIHLVYSLREMLRTRGQTLRLVVAADSPAGDALRLAGVTSHIGDTATLDQALAQVRDASGGGQGSVAERSQSPERPLD